MYITSFEPLLIAMRFQPFTRRQVRLCGSLSVGRAGIMGPCMRYRFVVLDFGANAVSNPEKNGIHGFRILRAVPLTTSGGNERPVSILRLPQFVERVESSSTQAQVAGTRSLFADQRGRS